jgi:hypothetical protein
MQQVSQDEMKTIQTADKLPVHCAFDELVRIGRLRENPANPNRHPDNQIALLCKIILKTGWRAPITVSRRSGLIVRGHGRLYAARLGNFTEAPVDYQDYESDAEEIADLVADNRVAELAEMDLSVLGDQLRYLENDGLDLEIAGFDVATVEQLLGGGPPMASGDYMGEGIDPTPPEMPPRQPKKRKNKKKYSRIVLHVDEEIRDAVMSSIEALAEQYEGRFKIAE